MKNKFIEEGKMKWSLGYKEHKNEKEKRSYGHQSKSPCPRTAHDTCQFYVGL
jgi:hypothetical protein